MTKNAFITFLVFIHISSLQAMEVAIKSDEIVDAKATLALGRNYARGEGCIANADLARKTFDQLRDHPNDEIARAWAALETFKLAFQTNKLFYFDRASLDFITNQIDNHLFPEELLIFKELLLLKKNEYYFYNPRLGNEIRDYYSDLKRLSAAQKDELFAELLMDGDFDLVIACGQQLLSRGIPVDATETGGVTLLYQGSVGAGKQGIEFLVKRGAHMQFTTEYGDTPLHNAAFYGNNQALEQLILMGADSNAQNKFGLTPLHYAVMMGETAAARLLISLGAQVSASDCNGQTPLHWAVLFCHREMVSLLISSGADRWAVNKRCSTAFELAGKTKYLEGAELLREKRKPVSELLCDLAKQNYEFGKHLLKMKDSAHALPFLEKAAVQKDDKQIAVLALLELAHYFGFALSDEKKCYAYLEQAKVLCKSDPSTLLEESLIIIFLENVELLRKLSLTYPCLWKIVVAFSLSNDFPKLCEASIDHLTPGPQAQQDLKLTQEQEIEIAQLLRTLFLKDLKNSDLHFGYAVRKSFFSRNLLTSINREYPHLASRLLAAGEDVHQTGPLGDTPLDKASNLGYVEVMKELINYGAQVNPNNPKHIPPLHEAIRAGKLEAVRVLCAAHASLLSRSYLGETPLHHTLTTRNPAIAAFLIDQTPEGLPCDENPLEITDRAGNSPLHAAARRGMLTIADKLILRGCQINRVNKRMNTPLHEAVLFGQTAVARRLLFAGANVNSSNDTGDSPLHTAAHAVSPTFLKVLTTLPKLAPFSDARDAQRKLFTALVCMRRYQWLPRALIFKIFTAEHELEKDFAVVLLRGSQTLCKRNETTIANSSRWRLLVAYTIDGRTAEMILPPDDVMVLPTSTNQITNLTATVYGNYWRKLPWASLHLLPLLQEESTKDPTKNIEITIDGGDEGVREFTRPFTTSVAAHDKTRYEPVSRMPNLQEDITFFNIIDAFPCLRFKVKKGQLKTEDILTNNFKEVDDRPRLILKLAPDATTESIDFAYEILTAFWQREILLNPANVSFIRVVLENLTAAHVSLKTQKPFQFVSPSGEETQMHEQPLLTNILALKFFNKRAWNEHETVLALTELCIANDQEALMKRNAEGKTALQCVLDSDHNNGLLFRDECFQILMDAEASIRDGSRREVYYKLMRRLLYGTYDLQVIEGKQPHHIPNQPLLRLTPLLFSKDGQKFTPLGYGTLVGPPLLTGMGPAALILWAFSYTMFPFLLENL